MLVGLSEYGEKKQSQMHLVTQYCPGCSSQAHGFIQVAQEQKAPCEEPHYSNKLALRAAFALIGSSDIIS